MRSLVSRSSVTKAAVSSNTCTRWQTRSITIRSMRAFYVPRQLAVVILADEDDCSVSDPTFFDPSSATLGPLQSFRCFPLRRPVRAR